MRVSGEGVVRGCDGMSGDGVWEGVWKVFEGNLNASSLDIVY